MCKVLVLFCSSFGPFSCATIPLEKRESVALRLLLSECQFPVIVLCLFLIVPWVALLCVIVAFPAHTHFLFGISKIKL